MLKSLFSRSTTKGDVIMSIAAAVVGVWKATDTVKKYKAEQSEKEEGK